MANFRVGDEVKILKPHPGMSMGKEGVIVEASRETPYAIRFEGMLEVHKWYVGSELEAETQEEEDRESAVGDI